MQERIKPTRVNQEWITWYNLADKQSQTTEGNSHTTWAFD